MKLKLGNAVILAYQRLPYRPWYAIAEFVDNSTDAYFRAPNKPLLDKAFKEANEQLDVEVTFDKKQRLLRITDNSMGMSLAELEAAMIIGERPLVTAGRSEYGMGMKTAAIWFANTIHIRTKKLGETTEYRTTIDVERFVEGTDDLEVKETPKPANLHYTIIELENIRRNLGESAMSKARQFLGSIYRTDLRNNTLRLTVNGEEVKAPTSRDDDAFLTRSDGSKLVVDIDLTVNGKPVKGWIGVLKPGSSGRSNAGFALIRHGRTVRGWLDSWRPDEIFGEARNDLLNQRIAGELHLDAFSASHTKDAIDWEGDEEESLGEALKQKANEYGLLKEAKRKVGRNRFEGSIEDAEAQAQLEAQLTSPKLQDEFLILDVPKPEVADLSQRELLDAAIVADSVVSWPMPQQRTAYLFELDLSPNDPYYTYEVLPSTDLRIVINASHPAYSALDTAEAKLAHYHHVVFDAVAEYFCGIQREAINPSSIRQIKDKLFRTVTEVAEGL
jgi:hypothetical protein